MNVMTTDPARMHLNGRLGSIEIEHRIDDSGAYDSFMLDVSVDIGHGVFKATNADIHFRNLAAFIGELDAFILDRTVKPRLEGTYDSYIEFSGTPSMVSVSFCVGDAFFGNTRFALIGAFDIDQDYLSAALEQFRALLESWRGFGKGQR